MARNNLCKLPKGARSEGMATLRVSLPGLLVRKTFHPTGVIVAVIVLAFAIPTFAQSPLSPPLTNADIVKMVKAGVPESVIVRKVQMSESNFSTSPNALIELKREHVPDDVMGAMLDSEAAMRMPLGEPGMAPPAVYSSPNGHPHHLPTFDAALRIDSKTEKVSVGKNQIKVEQAGVPIFTLKWKETQSK
jgi:hypothetical protein